MHRPSTTASLLLLVATSTFLTGQSPSIPDPDIFDGSLVEKQNTASAASASDSANPENQNTPEQTSTSQTASGAGNTASAQSSSGATGASPNNENSPKATTSSSGQTALEGSISAASSANASQGQDTTESSKGLIDLSAFNIEESTEQPTKEFDKAPAGNTQAKIELPPGYAEKTSLEKAQAELDKQIESKTRQAASQATRSQGSERGASLPSEL